MKKFKKVFVEITNVCNLSCAFCPKTKRNKSFMTPSEFEVILGKISGYANQVYLHVMGEPLLHPQLEDILQLCDQYSIKANITTNGTLLESASSILLKAPALRQLNISLHSISQNDTDLLKGLDMHGYLDNVFKFIDQASEESNVIVKLRLWNLEEMANNKDTRANNDVLQSLETNFNLDFKIEDKLTEIRGLHLTNNVFLSQSMRFEWPSLNAEEYPGDAFCYGLRDQFAILVDGTVVPCCLDNEGVINLGNIFNQDLSEIIEGPRASNIYKGFTGRSSTEELCKKCGYRKRFSS